MPIVINNHQIIDDEWVDCAIAGNSQRSEHDLKVIVDLDQLRNEFVQLKTKSHSLAVRLSETDSVDDILPFLNHLQMVIL